MSKLPFHHFQKIFWTYLHNHKRFLPLMHSGINTNRQLNYSDYSTCLQKRLYSEKKAVAIQRDRSDQEISTDVKTTIKETTKTVSYSAVILLGIGVTAVLFYAIFRELFSSKSPSGIYSQAFKKCCNDPRVQDSLGTPIKGHGEESSRRSRSHVRCVYFCYY